MSPSSSASFESCPRSWVSRVLAASSRSSSARAEPMSPEDAYACARHIATSRPCDAGVPPPPADRRGPGAGAASTAGRAGCAGGTARSACGRRRACYPGRRRGRRPASTSRWLPRSGTGRRGSRRGSGPTWCRGGWRAPLAGGRRALPRPARAGSRAGRRTRQCSGLAEVAASNSRPALMASSTRPEPRLEPGDPREVLGPVAAVDLGQAAQGHRRRRPGCRPTRGPAPPASRPGSIGARSRSPGRPRAPPRAACRRPRDTGPARSSLSPAVALSVSAPRARVRIASIRAASRPAAWSFFTRDSRTATRCSSRSASRPAAASWISASSNRPSRCRYSASFIRRSKSSFSSATASFERADRLLEIAEARQHLGQPAQVPGVPIGPLGDLGPLGHRLGGPLEPVQVLAEILLILGVRRATARWPCGRGPAPRRPSRPAATDRRPARS